MNKNLVYYIVFALFDILFCQICLKYIFISFMEIDYFGLIIFSILFSWELNEFINRQRNFVKYYPHFEDKWLGFFYYEV